jgi:acetolactate synthase-1/3 small subunit
MEIDKLTKDLKPYGLVSVSRTGAVAMTKGAEILK